MLLIGAFAWLINDWQQLSETIYAGFIELGLTAGGGSLSRADFLNPGAILAQGWEIVKALGETPAPVDNPLDVVGNMSDALILGLAMIGIMLAFAVLALQIVVSLRSSRSSSKPPRDAGAPSRRRTQPGADQVIPPLKGPEGLIPQKAVEPSQNAPFTRNRRSRRASAPSPDQIAFDFGS